MPYYMKLQALKMLYSKAKLMQYKSCLFSYARTLHFQQLKTFVLRELNSLGYCFDGHCDLQHIFKNVNTLILFEQKCNNHKAVVSQSAILPPTPTSSLSTEP